MKTPKSLFVLFLVLYVASAICLTRVAGSQEVFKIGSMGIPLVTLSGVFSSVGNICMILLVVFFHKTGFIVAVIVLAGQIPVLLQGFFVRHNPSSISGLFMNVFAILTVILIYRRNKKLEKYQGLEIAFLKEQEKLARRLFEQTATALVNAIDAKDAYSSGHSLRVAEYSEKIAREMGKSEEECGKIYYAALLHDVGKIGIDESIINKNGKLTSEEYEVIKQHSLKGSQILTSISEYPYLSIGAHFHHERYDGKGYPEGLKGTDIPEIARIISVADAYDAMSSNRSYRTAFPQQIVREEIVKGTGTQFDPEIAGVMKHLIDLDENYEMREKSTVREFAGKREMRFGKFRSEISDGIRILPTITKIRLKFTAAEDEEEGRGPAMVLFDSLDGRVHADERMRRELNYYEYCEVWLDGRTKEGGIRKIETRRLSGEEKAKNGKVRKGETILAEIEAVKQKDHVLLRIRHDGENLEVTVALPDSSRYVYVGLTGEHGTMSDVSIETTEQPVEDDYVPRIAEEISYIRGEAGDIPNVQVDGFLSDATEAVPITDGMKITFHTMSLPTARLIWHCPFINIFSSEDKKVNGKGYRGYAMIRLDGENWSSDERAKNELTVTKSEKFQGWDAWKENHKKGLDCTISFVRRENVIITMTDNLGIYVENKTKILDGTKDVYVSLTGDQCALTNIRIEKKNGGR